MWQINGQHLRKKAKHGPNLVETGEVSRSGPNSGQNRTQVGHSRLALAPNLVTVGAKLARFGPLLAEIGANVCSKLAQIWSNSGRIQPISFGMSSMPAQIWLGPGEICPPPPANKQCCESCAPPSFRTDCCAKQCNATWNQTAAQACAKHIHNAIP